MKNTNTCYSLTVEASGCIVLTTHFNPEDGCRTASETLISNHHTTRRKNPEKHFY